MYALKSRQNARRTFDFSRTPLLNKPLRLDPVVFSTGCTTLPIIHDVGYRHYYGSRVFVEVMVVKTTTLPIIPIAMDNDKNFEGFAMD
jgi:hypothetical protein